MKKLVLITAIVLLTTVGAKAQSNDTYWSSSESYTEEWNRLAEMLQMFATIDANDWRSGRDVIPDVNLPGSHNTGNNFDSTEPLPIGSGTFLLIGFGGAYAAFKKRRKK